MKKNIGHWLVKYMVIKLIIIFSSHCIFLYNSQLFSVLAAFALDVCIQKYISSSVHFHRQAVAMRRLLFFINDIPMFFLFSLFSKLRKHFFPYTSPLYTNMNISTLLTCKLSHTAGVYIHTIF